MSKSHTRRLGISWAFLVVLVLPALASAQRPTLGEVARKEQERRKAAKSSEKVLTNKDLPPAAAKPVPAPGTGTPVRGTAAAPEQKPDSTIDEQKDEAWWRERITQTREGLRRSESFLEALQTRVNVLSADFTSRDDPVQRARIGEDRQKALAEMDRVSGEIAMFKKQIADIEEEARKAGVPPGWLR
jgi:hypothetical protein